MRRTPRPPRPKPPHDREYSFGEVAAVSVLFLSAIPLILVALSAPSLVAAVAFGAVSALLLRRVFVRLVRTRREATDTQQVRSAEICYSESPSTRN